MDDDFNDDYVPDTGRAFGRGRPVEDNDGWDSANGDDDGGWGSSSKPPRGGGRGGRGSHGGGRRGGSSHKNDSSKRNDWNKSPAVDDGENEGWGDETRSRSENRGRGGRGRGRGRGGGRGGRSSEFKGASGDNWNGENGDGDGTDNKPKEKYIPPDLTADESELFSSGNSIGINFDKFDEIDVKVSGENIPSPISSFEESGLRQYLLDNVKKSNYLKPTPIQKHAIPIIMDGRDVMGCAQTGSGKTAAFLLPILHKLLNDPKDVVLDSTHVEPEAIIVSPTRELTIQIHSECRKFSLGSIIKTVVAYGGTAVFHQAKQLMNGCHVLVATPGRLMDFVKSGRISFNSVRFIVLDEADRMLDMGFLPEIEKMMNHETMVPSGERQTLMFSATFPEEIQHLAGQFLTNYLFITVGVVGGACADVSQTFYQVDKFNKRTKLLEILQEHGTQRTLVFIETKRNADFLASFLCENNFQTTSIHGDRLQREREEALGDFKSGRRDILVATGVAARGLDIKNVKHVINYDLPNGIDEYVHRIGRTGRVGNKGMATSFYDSSQDSSLAKDLIKILQQCNQQVPDWLLRDEGASGGGNFRNSKFGGRDVRGDDFGRTEHKSVVTVEEEEEW